MLYTLLLLIIIIILTFYNSVYNLQEPFENEKCPYPFIKKRKIELIGTEIKGLPCNTYWCEDQAQLCGEKCCPKNIGYSGQKWCGISKLYNTDSKVYNTKQECIKDVDRFSHLERYDCLRTTGAGWCTNSNGNGKCVAGAPDRPTDIIRYNYCFPNKTDGINSYIPGVANSYILQNFNDNQF